jgi:hypothetical protein
MAIAVMKALWWKLLVIYIAIAPFKFKLLP